MKKFFSFLVTIGLVLSLLTPAYAVNTVRQSGGVIELTAIDTTWYYTDALIKIHSIMFIPAAADDRCIIRDGSATGPIFLTLIRLLTLTIPKESSMAVINLSHIWWWEMGSMGPPLG